MRGRSSSGDSLGEMKRNPIMQDTIVMCFVTDGTPDNWSPNPFICTSLAQLGGQKLVSLFFAPKSSES